MEHYGEFFYGVFGELFLWNVFFSLWVAQRADVAELILENIFMDWSEVLFSLITLHRYVEMKSCFPTLDNLVQGRIMYLIYFPSLVNSHIHS